MDESAAVPDLIPLIDALFNALELVSRRNQAYRDTISKQPNSKALSAQVKQSLKTLYALSEPDKYSDLRQRAIAAVQGHNFLESDLLARTVQERSGVWG